MEVRIGIQTNKQVSKILSESPVNIGVSLLGVTLFKFEFSLAVRKIILVLLGFILAVRY